MSLRMVRSETPNSTARLDMVSCRRRHSAFNNAARRSVIPKLIHLLWHIVYKLKRTGDVRNKMIFVKRKNLTKHSITMVRLL